MLTYSKVLSGNSNKLSNECDVLVVLPAPMGRWVWSAAESPQISVPSQSPQHLSCQSQLHPRPPDCHSHRLRPQHASVATPTPPCTYTHRVHVISADSITESVWMSVTVRRAASSWRGSCRACWVIAERPGRAADWRSCRASGRPHTDRTELSADSCGDTPASPEHTHQTDALVQFAVESPLLTL